MVRDYLHNVAGNVIAVDQISKTSRRELNICGSEEDKSACLDRAAPDYRRVASRVRICPSSDFCGLFASATSHSAFAWVESPFAFSAIA